MVEAIGIIPQMYGLNNLQIGIAGQFLPFVCSQRCFYFNIICIYLLFFYRSYVIASPVQIVRAAYIFIGVYLIGYYFILVFDDFQLRPILGHAHFILLQLGKQKKSFELGKLTEFLTNLKRC